MNTSDRVRLIRLIAEVLGGEDWHVIDLTLRQFGLPTSQQATNGPLVYVIDMVDQATDSVLLALAEHLGVASPMPRRSVQAACWEDGAFRLFLSHISAHKIYLSEIRGALRTYSISGFVAHEDIEPGREWQAEIEAALHSADALAAFLTPGFHESRWTDQEVGVAVGRSLLVVPVRMGLDPYGFIGKYQGVQASGRKPSAVASDIFAVLAKHPFTRRRLSEACVASLEKAGSFQRAKDCMSVLEEYDFLDTDLQRRIEKSVEENYEVREAFGVPSRIERLLRRLRVESGAA